MCVRYARERGSVSTFKPLIQTMKDSGEGFMKGGCRGKIRRNIISTSLTPEPRCKRRKVHGAVVVIAVDIRGCAGARTGVRVRSVRVHRVYIWGWGGDGRRHPIIAVCGCLLKDTTRMVE